MKILALERESTIAQAADFQPYLKQEARLVYELYQAGVVREIYFHAEQHTAVLVLECTDMEEARATLRTLPLVQQGLITFDLIPLEPYSGFSRLFDTEC